MTVEVREYYDAYWRAREEPRTEARSRERAALVLALLGPPGPDARLVDLGCGPGWGLDVFRDAGWTVAGVDASVVAVEAARARGIPARQLDLERDALEGLGSLTGGAPEVFVALEVLEHLVDPSGFLSRLQTVVGRDGRLIVSLPNEIHVLARLRILFGRLPFGGHRDPHLRHFDLRQARRLFSESGYRVRGERAVPLAPPRWTLLRLVSAPLVRLLPGLFSIGSIYELEADGSR